MNCSCMPWSVRVATLWERLSGVVDAPSLDPLPPGQPDRPTSTASETDGAPLRKKSKSSAPTNRVDLLSVELSQMKELLLALQPRANAPEPPQHCEETLFPLQLPLTTLVTL